MSQKKKKVEDLNKLIVSNEKGLRLVKRFVKSKHCNSFGHNCDDYISIGWDDRPDSDWGRYTKYGTIIVRNPDLFDSFLEEIRKSMKT